MLQGHGSAFSYSYGSSNANQGGGGNNPLTTRPPMHKLNGSTAQTTFPPLLPQRRAQGESIRGESGAAMTTTSVVKQGWILKKGGSGFLAPWRRKYLSLISIVTASPAAHSAGNAGNVQSPPRATPSSSKMILRIFDQFPSGDSTTRPKHEISLRDDNVKLIAIESSPTTGGFTMLSRSNVAFTLVTRSRKFYFAASSLQDFNDWQRLLNSTPIQQTPQTAASMVNGSMRSIIYQERRGQYNDDDDDARSVYSVATSRGGNGELDDDTMSVVSGTSTRRSGRSHGGDANNRLQEGVSNDSLVSSTFETLSFSSEAVLTPAELSLMGQDSSVLKGQLFMQGFENTEKNNSATKRKGMKVAIPLTLTAQNIAPVIPGTNEESQNVQLHEDHADWHKKFVSLLEVRSITEDQALQKDVNLMELIGAFQERVSMHAKLIIDEYHISSGLVGSSAGGLSMKGDGSIEKDGIIFRFACDYDTATPAEIEEALAQTSAELRSINATIKAIASYTSSTNDEDAKPFFTILMALVDYKGFRVIGHADIAKTTKMSPLHDLTPSESTGCGVMQINEGACLETAGIASLLNLGSHTVQVNDDRRVRVALSATVEIHIDLLSQKQYLTCLRDIFPIDYYAPESLKLQTQRFNPLHRLRPEFLSIYQHTVCSDALTPTSGASKREREVNDDEAMKAARFLRENWIPAFVRALDGLDVRAYDSASLTGEMHRRGINMRYLGFICRTCTIPHVRQMILVEMIARVCKSIFQQRLRGAILHFRSVGATAIEDQMNAYTANLLSTILGYGEKTLNFLEGKLKPEIRRKFTFDLSKSEYVALPRSALFLSIQYHCGITAEDTCDYDFSSAMPISKSRLVSFETKVKTLTGTQYEIIPNTKREESRLAYVVAKHFKSLGPRSKLQHTNSSAAVLTFVAAHYNASNKFEEARLYGQAAASSAQKNHVLFGLAAAQLLHAIAGLQINAAMTGPDPSLLACYGKALAVMSWHWGPQNPLCMTLYDKMSFIYHKAKDPQRAFEFHRQSFEVAEQSLGNNHAISAGYLTRSGCYLANLGKLDEAIRCFTQALNIFSSSRADPSLIAEVHYHYADVYAQKGDYDRAIEHGQKCRKMREACFGFSDERVIHSCRQVSKLLLAPYKDYKGVLTANVKNTYKEVISCHEKVFRYLQSQQGASARRKSMRRSMSKLSSVTSTLAGGGGGHNPDLSAVTEIKLAMAGPLVVAPFGWTPPFPRNLMHKLTKEIVSLKLALVELPVQKECIRTLRARRQQGGVGDEEEDAFDAEEAKGIIMRMAAVTPSVYLDDVLQRVTIGDGGAIHELNLVLMLTESETVGLRN